MEWVVAHMVLCGRIWQQQGRLSPILRGRLGRVDSDPWREAELGQVGLVCHVALEDVLQEPVAEVVEQNHGYGLGVERSRVD